MTDAQDTPAEDQHAASRSMAAAEANRLGVMRINHRFALHVEMLDGLPERECMQCSPNRGEIGNLAASSLAI